jgi:hypothetical protein
VTESKLRELERRWKHSGALEDEVVYLRERVRAGLLDGERLELALRFGSEAAGEVLGRAPARLPGALRDWHNAVEALEEDARVQLCLSAGAACLEHLGGSEEREAGEALLAELRETARTGLSNRPELLVAEERAFELTAAIPHPPRSTRQRRVYASLCALLRLRPLVDPTHAAPLTWVHGPVGTLDRSAPLPEGFAYHGPLRFLGEVVEAFDDRGLRGRYGSKTQRKRAKKAVSPSPAEARQAALHAAWLAATPAFQAWALHGDG